MTLVVAKFGGTSMGGSEAIKKVAEILMGKKRREINAKDTSLRFVSVVSATSGTTDQLIKLAELALNNQNWEEVLRALEEKHEKIVEELEVDLNLHVFFKQLGNFLQGISLIGEISLSAKDKIMSFGERISSNILAKYLEKNGIKAKAVDSFDLVFADNSFADGKVDFEKSDEAILRILGGLLKEGILPVVTGFIGQSESGDYITLGRGGSDYSGAIIAAALNADELQIWTDVDGILNTDPRLIKEAKVLPQVSFNEASELAYFGAKVLHPKTIKPAISKNIPVKILNTFNVSAPGTLITSEETESIKSVTFKKIFRLLIFVLRECWMHTDFWPKFLKCLREKKSSSMWFQLQR